MAKDGKNLLVGGLEALREHADGGGLEEKPRRRVKDDGEKKNPGPTAQPRYRRQTSSVTNPVVAPEIRKEVSTMTNPTTTPATTPALATSQDMEPCPLCGYRKPKEITIGDGKKVRPIVCKGCSDKFHGYEAEIVDQLASGKKVEVLSRHAWILSQIDLTRFGQDLNQAFLEKERLANVVQAKLAAHGRLSPGIFIPLRDRYQKETGASAAYGTWRRMQARLVAATEVRPQVEKMVADEATRNAEAAAKAAAPASIPAETPAKTAPRKRTVKATAKATTAKA